MRNTSADKENLMTNMAIPGEQDSDSEVKTNIFKSIAYAFLKDLQLVGFANILMSQTFLLQELESPVDVKNPLPIK